MPPPHSPGVPFIDEHLPLLLTRAAAAVSSGGDASPHRLDITAPAGRVLAALSDMPDTPVGRLAKTCALQQPTVTKVLAQMERSGLVRRHQDSQDQRVVRVALTPQGQALAADLLLAAKQHEAKLLAHYPPAGEIKDVLRALIAQGVRGTRR